MENGISKYSTSDLLKYGQYIQSGYEDCIISCTYNFSENSIGVRCFYTTDFVFSFSDKEYVVKRKITDTIYCDYIGGAIINEMILPNNLKHSVDFIINYSRTLLGDEYINDITQKRM